MNLPPLPHMPFRVVAFTLVLACSSLAQEPDRGALTMKVLLQRQEYQRTISNGLKAFHNFKFEDGFL